MRRGRAVLLVGLATALGAITGAVLLPERSSPTQPPTASASAVTPTPSATPSATASPTPPADTTSATGPATIDDLLTVADFADVGLTVTERPSSAARLDVTGCTKTGYRRETLAELAHSGPPVQRSWEGATTSANEQAVTVDIDEAVTAAQRVLRLLETCQRRPATYWVYGPTRTTTLSKDVTISWLGSVDGAYNTTGRAPRNGPYDGGVAVMRHRDRVAVIYLGLCSSAGDGSPCQDVDGAEDTLAALARTAAHRLG